MKRIIAGAFVLATLACRSNDPAATNQTAEASPAPPTAATQTTAPVAPTPATATPQTQPSGAAPASPTATTTAPSPTINPSDPEAELARAARVNVTDLKRMVDAGEALIVDVRPAEAFAEGHIKGAINVPLTEFQTRIGELPKDKYLATYCT